MIKIFKKRKGQNVAEYAILIAMVVGALLAMQKFVQRGLQARNYDAARFLVNSTKDHFGEVAQYEPYYLDSQYDTTRDATDLINSTADNFVRDGFTETVRAKDGFQATGYTPEANVEAGMTFDE